MQPRPSGIVAGVLYYFWAAVESARKVGLSPSRTELALFIQDAPAQDARSVWERLVPQPFQPWDAKLDLAEFCRMGD